MKGGTIDAYYSIQMDTQLSTNEYSECSMKSEEGIREGQGQGSDKVLCVLPRLPLTAMAAVPHSIDDPDRCMAHLMDQSVSDSLWEGVEQTQDDITGAS